MPREDIIHSLALAIVPEARKRREETDAQRRARKTLAGDLEEVAWDIVEGELNERPPQDEMQVAERIKAKLSKYAVDGGVGSSIRYNNLVSRLKAHPNRPRNIAAILSILEQLSFSSRGKANGPSNSVTSQARGTSRPTIGMPSLAVPNAGAGASASSSRPASASSSQRPSKRSGAVSPSLPPEDFEANSNPAGRAHTGPLAPSERVRQWRQRAQLEEVPEEELLRDVIYLLQGINGQWVQFEESFVMPDGAESEKGREGDDRPQKVLRVVFKEDAKKIIPRTKRQLIHQITELGRLHRRIDEFVQRKNAQPDAGLAMQSFCHFIAKEMTEYYRLIAILESQLSQTEGGGSMGDPDHAGPSSRGADELQAQMTAAPALTLKRVSIWTKGMLLRMRLISAIIERCQDAKGGALASLIHTYSFNGDPLIKELTAGLLEEVSRPFFEILSKWIFEGELCDPYQEFFVQINTDLSGGDGGENSGAAYSKTTAIAADQLQDADAAAFWLHRFSLRREMLPSFMTEEFGRKIFSTGKSLNFIRYACGASDWLPSQQSVAGEVTELRYSDIDGLQRTVNTAHNLVSKHLVDIFLNKLKLLDHLRALQDYLMLGKGDFVDLLKTQLEDYLNRPSNSLHRHHLTIALETAIRGSNAQFDDPEVIKRLDARLLEDSAGDTGWDVFTLEYKVDAPVNTILDGPAMQAYQLIFGHLWRVKRAEVALATAWTRVSCSRFDLQKMKKPKAHSAELLKTLNKASVMLGEMNHMIRQLQGFFQLECTAYSWQDLLGSLKAEVDLDELIDRHQKYVNALVSKILLRQSTKRNDPDFLASEVRASLVVILAFCAVANELSHYTVAFVQGQDDEALRESILERLTEQSQKFQEHLQTIIERLERHSNLIVRELSTRLNFNMYYEAGRKDRKREASHAA